MNAKKKAPQATATGAKVKSKFHLAAQAASLDAVSHFDTGLGAVKGCYRPCIKAQDTRRLKGSLDLDGALASIEPGAHRWDYGIGLQLPGSQPEVAVWVEFHHAATSEVDVVLKKLDWLLEKLRMHKQLDKLTRLAGQNGLRRFHWLPTESGVHIPSHTPQARKLAARGLSVTSRVLHLP
jgi:hypothetical protein